MAMEVQWRVSSSSLSLWGRVREPRRWVIPETFLRTRRVIAAGDGDRDATASFVSESAGVELGESSDAESDATSSIVSESAGIEPEG